MSALEPQGHLAVDGARLEYRWLAPSRPGLPALVLLHEGLGCVALWKDFPDRLAAATGAGVLVYSRAGYGRSSPVEVPRPLTYMHDEGRRVLPRLLDAAGLREVVLLGHSDGGSIALVHAGGADPAGRVKGAVTFAAHVLCEDLSVKSIAEARLAYLDGDLRQRLMRLHGDNVDCAFWGWNRAWLDPGFREWNLEEFLPGIRVPLLVVQGKDDQYGTEEQVHRIVRGAGGPTEALLLDACGHSPHRDQPEKALQAVVGFFARVTAPPK
ncbi:MAG: alpha/beta hydrolase [Deltaproteobacteria bacterium]|nr:alpha/beta hydrolase [Deltaproteobacteria bacterium]